MRAKGGACRFDSGVFTLLRSGRTRDRSPCQDACAEFALAQAWIRTMRQRQETTAMRSVQRWVLVPFGASVFKGE